MPASRRTPPPPAPGAGAALALPISQNLKLGGTAATYTAQTGCTGCPLLDNGCYAQTGRVALTVRRLNAAALEAGLSPEQLGQLEADAITARIPSGMPLRLHVVGDSPTNEAARPVAEACADRRGPTWGYTHFWRTVDRATWGTVSMLASCERPSDVALAHQRGYAAALIVPSFRSAHRYEHDGVPIIPCPEQTGRASSCAECRLCWRDDLLVGRAAIGFTPHGSLARRILEWIADPAP